MSNLKVKPLINFILNNKLAFIVLIIFILNNLLAGNFWLWNIFSIVPPIVFLVIYLFTIFFYFAKFKYLLSLFFILIMPLFWNNFDLSFNTFTNQKSNNSISLKIFNWNTQFWESENLSEFYSFLKSQNADIYHLQEHLQLKNNKFVEIEDISSLANTFSDYKIFRKSEFITLIKEDIEVVNAFTQTDSYFLRVDLKIKNNFLSVYNVHIPVQFNTKKIFNPFEFLSDLKSRYYLRELEYNKLITDIKSLNNDFYISGDFNTTTSMGSISNVLSIGKDAIFASNNIFNSSWQLGNIKLWRIDYNIVSNGIKVLEYKEVNPKTYSDHWAQLVTIQI